MLTRVQRLNLGLFLKFRDRPMTVGKLLRVNFRLYMFSLIYLGTLAGVAYYGINSLASAFVAVAAFSVFLRDIGRFRVMAALWPMYQHLLDWERVEKLAESEGLTDLIPQ